MSVEENLELGAWTFKNDKNRVQRKLAENYERFPVLKTRRKSNAGELSGGMQRMVEIGRTLMTDPTLILVDEPTAGLAKLLSEEVYQMLVDLRDRDGLTILLVDQEIRLGTENRRFRLCAGTGPQQVSRPGGRVHRSRKGVLGRLECAIRGSHYALVAFRSDFRPLSFGWRPTDSFSHTLH